MNFVDDVAATKRSVLDRVSTFGNDSIVASVEKAATKVQLYNLLSSFQAETGRPRFVFVVNDNSKTAVTNWKVMTNWPHELFDQAVQCGMVKNLAQVGIGEIQGGDTGYRRFGLRKTEQLVDSEAETAEFSRALNLADLERTHGFVVSLGQKTDVRMTGLLDGAPLADQSEIANDSAVYKMVGNKMLSLGAQETSKAPLLSKRETECIRWTAEGKTSYEIGIILGLSENTINNYIASVTKKMGAVNRSHMISLAFRNGIIS